MIGQFSHQDIWRSMTPARVTYLGVSQNAPFEGSF